MSVPVGPCESSAFSSHREAVSYGHTETRIAIFELSNADLYVDGSIELYLAQS